jgi:hypothetical protein
MSSLRDGQPRPQSLGDKPLEDTLGLTKAVPREPQFLNEVQSSPQTASGGSLGADRA